MPKGTKLQGLGLFLVMVTSVAATNTVYVAIDIETTGFSPRRNGIVELAAVKFTPGKDLGTWQTLLNPGHPVPRAATRIHGITTTMLGDAPEFVDAYPRFRDFVGDAIVIAHNAGFDLRFINAAAQQFTMPPLTNTVLDTLKMARSQWPGRQSYRLEALTKDLTDGTNRYHRALADAQYTADLFRVLCTNNVAGEL